jgi:hypothetical protein
MTGPAEAGEGVKMKPRRAPQTDRKMSSSLGSKGLYKGPKEVTSLPRKNIKKAKDGCGGVVGRE